MTAGRSVSEADRSKGDEVARKKWLRMAAFAGVLAIVAAACGDDGEPGADETPAGQQGGDIVLGAEQWPECLNPITQCANASWMHWTTAQYALPKLMEFDTGGSFVPSPVLAAEPEVQEEPFQITYTIRPEAKWDDGSDITSEDVEFTWRAYLNTTGTISTVGYDKITEIDTSDPKVAVAKFSESYAPWPDLFGGNSGYVLKKAAFPGADAEKPDLADEMTDSYGFSGGPWILDSFTKQQAVLTRNEGYWDADRTPLLDSVTFKPVTDQPTEIAELQAGTVAAIYPQPTPLLTQQFTAPGVQFTAAGGTVYEGLWLHQGGTGLDLTPFADVKVREAFMRAVDRQEIVDTIVKPDFPDAAVLNCAGWVPTVGEWCDNTDFEDITYDPDTARALLVEAGWTCPADGICEKDGEPLAIGFNTTTGNVARSDTQQLVKERAKAAGFDIKIKNFDAGLLFEKKLPKRDFELAEFANVASPDPSITTLYACDQIPSPDNDFSGQNWLAWCNDAATQLAKDSDRSVNPDERLDLIHQLGDLVRQDFVWLPLYQKPLYVAWRSDQVGGPVDAFAACSCSAFWNIYDWFELA